jgi:two-component system, LytTR family, response regulator
MIRVLIVDDEAPARAKLQRWLSEQPDLQVIGEADNGLQAAEQIERGQPQLVFLDIQMPGLSGLEVAAQLDSAQAPLLVFVTAFDEHAVKAFELNAVDYLLKPYDKDRLLKTLARVRERLGQHRDLNAATASPAVATARRLQQAQGCATRLLVPMGESLQLLDVDRIHWCEADDNYIHLHTAQQRYTLRRTLHDLLAQLNPRQFIRVHKSAAVNLQEIATLEPLFKGDYEIVLRSGQAVRMSRRYSEDLLGLLGSR